MSNHGHSTARWSGPVALAGEAVCWGLLALGAWLVWRGAVLGPAQGPALWSRAGLLAWWALAAWLAGQLGGGGRGGLWGLGLVLLAGLGAQFLLWRGLAPPGEGGGSRFRLGRGRASGGVVGGSPAAGLELVWPVLAALGLAALAWLVLGWLGLGRDGVLLAGATALVCLGLTVLGRVAAEYTGAGRAEVLAHLAPRHLAWFGVGLAGMVAGAWLGRPRRLARLARKKYLLPLAAAGLLVLTWLVGPEINRRRLWLVLGPFTLQTVELAKVLVVLFAAGYFADEFPFLLERRRTVGLEGLTAAAGPFAVMLGLPLLALFVQRDFGPAVLLGLFFLAMVYLATGAGWLPAAGLGLVVLAGTAGYHLGVPAMLQSRVDAWLEPFHTSEQLARGLWSIAAGGLWGSGWGLGHPHSVPLAYSDFVFAALSEEIGLVGSTAALALSAVLVTRCLVTAGRSPAAQARLAAAGVGVMLGLQTLLVTAGVTGLIPLAGLTLPLVSHGGSSLVVNLTLLGLVMGATGRAG